MPFDRGASRDLLTLANKLSTMDVEHVVGLFVHSDVTYIVGIPAQKNIFLTKAQEKI